MSNVVAMNPTVDAAVNAPFKVDVRQGEMIGEVSSQWFNRPHDQRFTSLNDLAAHVEQRMNNSHQFVAETRNIRVLASPEDPEKMELISGDQSMTPSHWSFGQMASLVKAPAGYLRKLPAYLAGVNLQYGFNEMRSENVKLYHDTVDNTLHAATGPEYGRVFDLEVVRAVQRIAGNGTGDTRWKIPGVIDWLNGTYNPFVNPTTDTTTLYASDRDVFMFLVDDTHPIEVGKMKNGDPDLVFRGFYIWNSEVGKTSLGISTFLLRGVCQNRMIWGAQDVQTIKIRHSKNAPNRFAHELAPQLEVYAQASDTGIVRGIQAAKNTIVATDDDNRSEFLTKRGFSRKQAAEVINRALLEEEKKPESVWDFVQGITAVARDIEHTDARLKLETKAGDLMKKAAKAA